ncbi:MAG: hypothetical protein WC389_04645 [Lutibacter sp.]|jgi:hypothetical protein
MNKKIITLIICLLTTLTTLKAQNAKVVITLKNGDTIMGYGKIKSDYLKYRINRNEKSVKIHFSKLERVKIYYTGETTNYVYLKVKNEEKYKVLEEVETGNVNLYKLSKQVYSPGYMGSNGNIGSVGFSGGYSYNINSFYVKKNGETEAIHLASNELFSKNFKEEASEYFKDCPQLVLKIQNKELKKRDLIEIIEFYNHQCN